MPTKLNLKYDYTHYMVLQNDRSCKEGWSTMKDCRPPASMRQTHHTQSSFHQASSVPHNTKKTVCDAWNGYHSIPIKEDNRDLTTFITPWGRYRYRTAPQGYLATGDAYTRRYDEISEIPNKKKW